MSQPFDSKTNFSPSLCWDELCNIADMMLRAELDQWRVSHHLTGIDIELFNYVRAVLEPVVSVGDNTGARHSVRFNEADTAQYVVTLYGSVADSECQAFANRLLPKLRQLQAIHPRLLGAQAFVQSPVIMWQAAELEGRWVLTQANAALAEFTGEPKESFIGKDAAKLVVDFVHPDDLAKLMNAYDFTRTTSRQMTLQYRLRNAMGDYVTVTEHVEYALSSDIKQSLSVVWHRQLDQMDSQLQYKLFRDIENFSKDISLESGRTFIRRFCQQLATIESIEAITLLTNTRSTWWESWFVTRDSQQTANFHVNISGDVILSQACWNRVDAVAMDSVLNDLLFGCSAYQSIIPLFFEGESVTAALVLGSQIPLRNMEAISQLVRIFGVRIVREIKQLQIADAQREQNELLVRQKQQLTNMVTLLGQLDAAGDEHEFLQTMETHFRAAFNLKCVDWVFWESGEWRYVNQLPGMEQQPWYADALPVVKNYWLRFLESCRRTGELTLYRGRLRVFWPLGQSEAGYLVVALTFHANMPDAELMHFTQNALALAKQGLLQRENLRYQATRDSLTDLGNRVQLHAWMKAQLPAQQYASLILFDLNRFKEINDSFGHQFGDKLLREIGPRISQRLHNKKHYLSRLGGDEFAVFFPDTDTTEALSLANELHAALAESYLIEGLRFQVEASVGVAHFPEHGQDGHELLRCADVAMYQAKSSNRPVVEFNAELDNTTPLRIAVLSELDTALAEGQLWVAYQPLMSTATGQTGGFEALIRWTHPTFGPLSPADFIPIAEMGEGIRKITDFVLHQTLTYLQTWRQLMPDLHVAVNISPRVLLNHQFPIHIGEMLAEYNLPGDSIIMELTESTLLVDPIRAVEIINQLGDMGVKVEIDDFGTGYSSLSYLKSLPITALKIDRSFVTDILQDSQNEVIVQSTVQMAHSLGLLTVAEGVEDEATLLKMMRLGCDMIQGYYYAKPLHGRDVADWLKRNM